MQQHTLITAQRLLNLYRQEHVIEGGWAAVNEVFLRESAEEDVLTALANLPTGQKLVEHINNLRSGKTPMNSIDNSLLPYGGMIFGAEIATASLTETEIKELSKALDKFEPTTENLEIIKKLPFVQKFGNDWIGDIKTALAGNSEILAKWAVVARTAQAFNTWDSARNLISQPVTERSRALIQANMLDFEMYLPMFGKPGEEALAKLRNIISEHK